MQFLFSYSFCYCYIDSALSICVEMHAIYLASADHKLRRNGDFLELLIQNLALLPTQLESQHAEVRAAQIHGVVKSLLIPTKTSNAFVLSRSRLTIDLLAYFLLSAIKTE